MLSRSDLEFLQAFESRTLPETDFNHRGHLRLAWLYLRQFSLEEAVHRTAAGISAYAASAGAEGKFHHTLTEAIVRIMHKRMIPAKLSNFDEFLRKNPDLIDNMQDIVLSYYSRDRLNSQQARRTFLPPDIRDL